MRRHKVLISRARLQRVEREPDMKIGWRYRLPQRFEVNLTSVFQPQNIASLSGEIVFMDSTHATVRVELESTLIRPGRFA
jgi:hypothetical protein